MKLFKLILLFILCLSCYYLYFGKNAIKDHAVVQKQIKQQKEKTAKLTAGNKNLINEIDDLRNGLDGLEENARYELGLIKQGETFYRILNSNNSLKNNLEIQKNDKNK